MNILTEEQLNFVISEICEAETLEESTAQYNLYEPILPDCKFVFASHNGASPGFSVNRTFSAGAVVRSLFKTPKVWVLDRETVQEMKTGPSTFRIDYSISLDTMALSYLEPYLQGKHSQIPTDFKEVFQFISRKDVWIDPLAYCTENIKNLKNLEHSNKIYNKLKAYETLRTLDTNLLESQGIVQSTLTEDELTKAAQEHIARMYMSLDDSRALDDANRLHQLSYCYLLKMVIIQFSNPKLSLHKKIWKLLEFSDKQAGVIAAREFAIAKEYFSKGQKLKFFGKIQKNKSDIFEKLDGMAWDLTHARRMELTLTVKPDAGARYFFPALLTFDKAFIEILDLYPLKVCAYVEGRHNPMPFYDGDWFELISENLTEKNEIMDRFYSAEAITNRAEQRKSAKLSDLISDLEAELKPFMALH
jgi:hypothetical protein